MNRASQRKLLSAMTILLTIVAIVGLRQFYVSRPGYGLPYTAQFLPEAEDRWNALGGTWEIIDGAMHNDSNDRGAKLLTGSPHWKNYIVEGDVQLLGAGSAGVIARVSEAEVGENSFKGYYAGVRMVDNSLDLGTFDFAYHEVAKIPLPEPVRAFRWYHVKLKTDGCQITASAWADGMQEIRTPPLNDPDCFRSGTAGLRSNGTGGVWRNFTVSPVGSTAPLRTASSFRDTARRVSTAPQQVERGPSVPVQPVNTLMYLPPLGSPVASVRGAVVLIRPAIYVEDATGGLEVQPNSATSLKIGDEVEVTGEVSLDNFTPVARKARIRLVREAVPVSPVIGSANQLATGPFDGRFVQVEGYLRAISIAKDHSVTMDLDAGTQSFHAILPAGRSWSHVQNTALQSRLRLRGVSMVGGQVSKAANPFAILVRSAEDVDLVAGPPWWRPSTLILACLVGLGLIFTFHHFYLLAEHWRLRAVANERERLAHEIHDTLAQSFAGIGFQLQAIRNRVSPGDGALKAQVDLAMTMARTSHEEARRSIASLRPESLGSFGLLPALRECAELMVKNGSLKVEASGDDGGKSLSPRIKDALYLIGQEAIANSIRHAHPGTIRIRLQRTRASVCLSVEDDGEGFVADTDRAGFGLPGMRKRAESISATLTVREQAGLWHPSRGKGECRIPFSDPTLAAHSVLSQGYMTETASVRIMIVDDHPVVRVGLASMLSTQPGIEVVGSASSGREALALLDTIAPDVILIDLRMPGMSGLEAIRAINLRANPPRILVLTSFDTDEDIYQSVGAGAQGYVLKDTPQDELLEAIRLVHAKKRYFPADIAARLTARMARSNLTPREHQVLQLVAKGLTNKEIGRAFGISDNTARNHVNSIIEKLEVSDRTEAATIAMRQGLVSITE